jgi:hypothetical protein
VIVSVLPALALTNTFAQPGRYCATLLAFWVELLIGPVKYWFPVILGYPSEYARHPMSGASTWVYTVCFLLTLAHPIKPRPLTTWITAGGFAIWYGWAFLTVAAYEY